MALELRDSVVAWNGGPDFDLVLTLGDNAYETGTPDDYTDKFFGVYQEILDASGGVYPAFGNHTYPQHMPWALAAFELESSWYAYSCENVRYVVLDMEHEDFTWGSPQYVWLENELAAAELRAVFTVVYGHLPIYTKGTHDSDHELDLIEARETLVPLFDYYGVDLFMSGHSHNYERSHLMLGHKDESHTFSALEHVIDDQDPYDVSNGGTLYVVAGASGKAGTGPFDHPAMPFWYEGWGCLVLDREGQKLQGTYLDRHGQEIDSWTLTTRRKLPFK